MRYFYQDDKISDFVWNAVYHTTPEFKNKLELMIREFQPQTFKEMVDVVASVFNGYVWERKEKIGFNMERIKDFLSSDIFQYCPCYTREDFFEYLCNNGMERAEA